MLAPCRRADRRLPAGVPTRRVGAGAGADARRQEEGRAKSRRAESRCRAARRARDVHGSGPRCRSHPRHCRRARLGRFREPVCPAPAAGERAVAGDLRRRLRRRLRRGRPHRLERSRHAAGIRRGDRGQHRRSDCSVCLPRAALRRGTAQEFHTIGAADIFEDRRTRDSLFDYWPLKRVVEQRVTAKLLSEIAAEHARGRRLFVVTTNLDAGRRLVWNMGAIAARGEQGLKLFRDILLASSSIPGFFSPVPIEVEANGKKFHELHGDGTLTAPFFVVPEAMLSAYSTSRLPFSQLYVLVNSKLGPEFKMPDRNIPGVLGRSIGVALTAALRTEVMLTYVGAQRHGVALRIAHVDPAFDHPSRGPFDGKYMQALYDVGVAAGKKGAAFGDTLPEFSMRGSASQQ